MIANEVSARYFGRPIRYEWNLLKRRQRPQIHQTS